MKKKKFVSSVAKMRGIMLRDPMFQKFCLSKENKNIEDTRCDTNSLHQNPNQTNESATFVDENDYNKPESNHSCYLEKEVQPLIKKKNLYQV